MKKILLALLLFVVCAPSWAGDKMCADTTTIGGGHGFYCPKPNPNSAPVSYQIDFDTGIVYIATTEINQVRVQVIGQMTGLVLDYYFYCSTLI